ncbi:MAG: phosphopantetheine-binding protein [Holophaga sp.]|jgi:acyl carrier protein
MKVQAFLDALCEALNREPGTITLADTKETLAEWNSIGHLSIIATVDSELNVPVDTPEMQKFSTIAELVARLKALKALED